LIIGIPDFLFSTISFFLIATSGELSMMPLLSLACTICPKRLEATVYSYFMSSINLGVTIGILFSSFLSVGLGITSTNFNELSLLLIISNLYNLIPCIVLIYLDPKYFNPKIPAKYQINQMKENELTEVVGHDENITKVIL
jgi:hypothetical protein